MSQKEKAKETEAVASRPSEVLPHLEHEMSQLFDEFWRRPFLSLWRPHHWWPSRMASIQAPTLDVYEEKDDVVVKAELPGLSKDDVEVNLSGSTLTIKGEKKKEEEAKSRQHPSATPRLTPNRSPW